MIGDIDPVALIVTVASLSLMPLIAVTATSFLKITAVLLILRNAIGVQQVPSNMVLYGVALVMSMLIMGPVIKEAAGRFTIDGVMPQTGVEVVESLNRATPPFKAFMLTHVDDAYHNSFYETAKKFQSRYSSEPVERNDLFVLMPSFVASELADAFKIGLLLYLPFVIIDLAVSCALMALGMMMVSPMSLTVPLKIILFVAVEGWSKVLQALMGSYL